MHDVPVEAGAGPGAAGVCQSVAGVSGSPVIDASATDAGRSSGPILVTRTDVGAARWQNEATTR